MSDSEPVLQKAYPIAMKHYDQVRSGTNKLLDAHVIPIAIPVGWHLSL